MISVQNLHIFYDEIHGIRDINLELPYGGTCSIVGPSGCGKTTFLHGIAGFLTPQKGSVNVGAIEEGGMGRVGLVQQKDALFPWLSIRANTTLGIRPERRHKESWQEINKQIDEILENLGILDTAERYPGQLSGGQRQRAAIARAMIDRPDALLLDEPTASLDAFGKEALQDLLLKLQMEHPVTTVFVTHDIEEALFLASRVIVMADGRIRGSHENPVYPQPEARKREEFYREVRALRGSLEAAIS